MSRGILTIVSGFSGAGKGTVMKAFLKKYTDYALSISVTTRSPRNEEQEGREYFFRSKEEFEKLIEENELLEYAQYSGNYYGTPRSYVEKCLGEGKDVILEIEIQGAGKVKKMFPDAVLVFVTPPSVEELYRRLSSRGTETPEQIAVRMETAGKEAEHMDEYDYLLINDSLEECVDSLQQIILNEHRCVERNAEFTGRIRSEFKTFKIENKQ
ncbi:MAG: guanylate kinase [Blautia sp.]|nr:guanylate kinase [Blautia sp.]MDY5032076.1 guanylate kinase [Blautia sp.]